MKFIIGKKVGMSREFREDGRVVPVTLVTVGPCTVTQVKTAAKDGYSALQIGFGKAKKLAKPQKGHLKEAGDCRYLREFRTAETDNQLKKGDQVTIDIFQTGERIKISGISKGKGFQGVVRRHGFHGHPATHGHKDQLRMPGSIGATGPAHVFKGTRMGGRMGNDKTTVKNLEIIKIDKEKNLLYVKGAVPGARNGLLLISGEGKVKEVVDDKK